MANLLMDLVSQSAGRALFRASSPASASASVAVRPAAERSSRCFEEALQGIDALGLAGDPIAAFMPAPTPPVQEMAVPVPGSEEAQVMAGREEAQATLLSGVPLVSMASADATTTFALVDAVPGHSAASPTTRTTLPGVAPPVAHTADTAVSDADPGTSSNSLPYGAWGSAVMGEGGIPAARGAAPAEPRAAALAATSRATGVLHASVVPAGLATPLVAAGAGGMRTDRSSETAAVVRTISAGVIVNSLESGAGLDRGVALTASQAHGAAATLMPASFAAMPSAELAKPAGAAVPAGEQPLVALLGERLHYQIARRTQHAVLRLDPPSMGSIEILIRNEGGSLHVHLRASNTEVARQLQGIGDSLRQDLAQRQQGEVSVQIDDGARDPDGRQRQRHAQAWQQAPGRGLEMNDKPHAAAFSMNTEAQ